MAEGRAARKTQMEEKCAVEAFLELKEKFPLNELRQIQELEDLFVFAAVDKLLEVFLLDIYSESWTAWTAKQITRTMWFSVVSADLRKYIRDNVGLQFHQNENGDQPDAPLKEFKIFKIMKGSFLRNFHWFKEIDFEYCTNQWIMEEEDARVHMTPLKSVD